MRLPRRVPWASLAEFDQVCSWIYNDANDVAAQTLAINRLTAWKAIAPLPQALESTLSLLVVLVQDQDQHPADSNPLSLNPRSYLLLRQSYASALIRHVNGLVDPLQSGAYARSIASIAQQLGLPQWLVELRHAATHEDLPSLELLRGAARGSMTWLLYHYFLPTLNPTSSGGAHQSPPPLRPLFPILAQYKAYLKLITRDASLKTQYQQEVNIVLRDAERWISEAKVTAGVVVGDVGFGVGDWGIDYDSKEWWALDRFCDVLLEKGMLVPLSKKKRLPQNTTSSSPFTLPTPLIAIWSPLLHHLFSLHPLFPSIFIIRACNFLTAQPEPPPPTTTQDPSFDQCLARWVIWCIQHIHLPTDPSLAFSSSAPIQKDKWSIQQTQSQLRKEAASILFLALGPTARSSSDSRGQERNMKAANQLLQVVCKDSPELEGPFRVLSQFQTKKFNVPQSSWNPSDIKIMTERLNSLVAVVQSRTRQMQLDPNGDPPQPKEAARGEGVADVAMDDVEEDILEEGGGGDEGVNDLPPGWRRVSPNWKNCPIGVYCPA